jgi:hypothetical protein
MVAMVKKIDKHRQPARTTIASVKKEMDEPRLTESVRNDRGYQIALLSEQKTKRNRSMNLKAELWRAKLQVETQVREPQVGADEDTEGDNGSYQGTSGQ